MSKQYKGWEIAKMISEGTLKAGDLLKTNYGIITVKIVAHHLETQESSRELGSSFFADGSMTYEIIPQPVSFMEIISNTNGFARVEHQIIDKLRKKENIKSNFETDFKKGGYIPFNSLMHILSFYLISEEIKTVLVEGEWYVEE